MLPHPSWTYPSDRPRSLTKCGRFAARCNISQHNETQHNNWIWHVFPRVGFDGRAANHGCRDRTPATTSVPPARDSQLLLTALHNRSRIEPLLQSEAAECGLACLTMVAGYHGHRVTLSE
ncbi:hypothetical protein G6L73_20355, partial [Agrobacterium rhizogenes]|uniref:cysteine peptidase family C39 domain-containing protein n=1 Tax=Rhizobium rhizogenes TaxID=359 RepID=UPI001571F887